MRPASSVQTRRAPTSTAVIATTSPSRHTAILEVPPPTSTFITGATVADRARDRAGAEGRHHGFEVVAGTDRDELAGLAGEQFADAARIAAADRDAGQDQGAGVDLVRVDHGVFVLLLEERAERVGVDGVLRTHKGVSRMSD